MFLASSLRGQFSSLERPKGITYSTSIWLQSVMTCAWDLWVFLPLKIIIFIASFNWVQVSTGRNGYSSLCHLPMEKPFFLRTTAMTIYHSLPTAQCLSVLPIPGASVHEVDLMGTRDLHLREERRKPNIYMAFSRPGSLSMESLSKQSCLSRPLGLERRPLVTWHAYMLLTCRVKTSKQQCMPRPRDSIPWGWAGFF